MFQQSCSARAVKFFERYLLMSTIFKSHVIDYCNFTKNERYHKLFFKAFDGQCGIATSYHTSRRTTTFVEHHSRAATVLGKFGKIHRQTSGIIRKALCYQSISVPRTNFTVEVGIFAGSLKL